MQLDTIVFATKNQGKLREVEAILADTGIRVISLEEAGFCKEIVEDADTFEGNALIKAKTVAQATGMCAMADDSGLEVDALGGQPGVYSARYLGEDTPYQVKNQTILDRLEGLSGAERAARFVCAIALCLPDGRTWVRKAAMEGEIAKAPAGENGFGYDPIFYLPEYQKTSAEISEEEKNRISHRGKALRQMAELIAAGL